MALEAVVFDMDGVLVDSEPFWIRDTIEFFRRHGIDVPYQEATKVVGLSMKDTDALELSWWGNGMSPEEYREIRHNDPERQMLNYADAVMPYAKYVLPRLKEAGLTVAIASSSTRRSIDRMLDECGLRPYVDMRVSGADFEQSKPNPEIYLYTVERLGVPKERVVAVEDSTVGVQAATAAGLTTIARLDARYNFDQSAADYIVGDLLQAYDVITRLMR